ncbi:MAG TPA: glycosyltransferase family 39 protein [Gaiellaceae bacterium]|nr:glycosyltransferase family 39 protein [Gaiellaceae bacterium]
MTGGRASERTSSGLPRLSPWIAAIAGLQAAVLIATSTRYGYHRDELYFIVAGSHPAFGYPDQPPIVPLVSWLMHDLAPGSLLLLRLPSALVAAVTTVIAALVAREIDGSQRAQLIAAAGTAVSGFALAVGHNVSTTTVDMLSTTLLLWLIVRALARDSGPSLLAAGLVVGIGFEAKPQVAVVAVIAALALGIVGPRWPLRSPWTAVGALVAVLLAAPFLIWQQRHGWPQVTVAGNIGGSAEGGRIGFVPFQIVMVGPLLVPVWVAGLLAPFRRHALRSLRFLPLTYAGLALAYLVGDGKAYYLASLYPTLLGVGALPVADWTRRRRLNPGFLTAAIALTAAISCYLALPLLPERSLQGSAVIAVNPDLGEQVGWPRFVDTVDAAWRDIPAAERARTAIFTANYGEAGAVDVLGRAEGLPRAYSGHNGFGEWGEPPARDTYALVIGYDGPSDATPDFRGCRTLATVDDGVGLDNDEQGLPLMLCRPARTWAILWPRLVHYD